MVNTRRLNSGPYGVQMGPTEKTGFFPGRSGLPDLLVIEKEGRFSGSGITSVHKVATSGQDGEGVGTLAGEGGQGRAAEYL